MVLGMHGFVAFASTRLKRYLIAKPKSYRMFSPTGCLLATMQVVNNKLQKLNQTSPSLPDCFRKMRVADTRERTIRSEKGRNQRVTFGTGRTLAEFHDRRTRQIPTGTPGRFLRLVPHALQDPRPDAF